MQLSKKEIYNLLNQLPQSFSFEELINLIELYQRIKKGENDIAKGNFIPHIEVKKIIESWSNKS